MQPRDDISDEEINRLIDGELSNIERRDIQARLSAVPARAAQVFAEAQRMEALRSGQPNRLFPPRESLDRAKQLERVFARRNMFDAVKAPLAAVLLLALGWTAHSLTGPVQLRQAGQTVDENFILAAREALRVAQLDAGPKRNELKQDKIERLVGAINISMPQLPATWQVVDVQVQPWNGKQSLVVTANTPSIGQITLVAAPMNVEDAIPPTSATDGRTPIVYWQAGGTAYALMGPATPERLEKEANGIEVANRKSLLPRIRG